MLRRWLPCVLIACSSTPSGPGPQPPAPPDDEERSVAWQQAHPAAPKPYTFRWEHLRGDRNYDGPCARGGCTPAPWYAALVVGKERIDHGRTRLTIDVNMHVTMDWFAAALDRDGHPISSWVHPDSLAGRQAQVTVDVDLAQLVTDHVALLKVRPR